MEKLDCTAAKKESIWENWESSWDLLESKLGWLHWDWWGSRKVKLGCIWEKMGSIEEKRENSLGWYCLESMRGLLVSRMDWWVNSWDWWENIEDLLGNIWDWWGCTEENWGNKKDLLGSRRG